MALTWRKRKKITDRTAVNLSGSGASVSHRRGPVTVNTRGRVSVRLPGGFTYRFKIF